MSNDLDPHQNRCSVGPDLGSNCLQRLSAEDQLLLAREKNKFCYGSYKRIVVAQW